MMYERGVDDVGYAWVWGGGKTSIEETNCVWRVRRTETEKVARRLKSQEKGELVNVPLWEVSWFVKVKPVANAGDSGMEETRPGRGVAMYNPIVQPVIPFHI